MRRLPELDHDPETGNPEHAAPLCAGSPRRGAGDLIRDAAPEDAGAIAALYRECFGQAMSEDEARGLLRSPGVAGLLSSDGFILLRSAADEAEILWIGVGPASRGRGEGAALLRAALGRMPELGVSRIFLEVSQSNLPAFRLYQSAGFAEVGRRRAYYPDGADALVLARPLRKEEARLGLEVPETHTAHEEQ